MDEGTTEPTEPTEQPKKAKKHLRKHLTLLEKIQIKAVCEYMQAHGHSGYHLEVFKHFRVSSSSGWRAVNLDLDTLNISSTIAETRGRKPKLTDEHLEKAKAILEERGEDAHKISWTDLAREVAGPGVGASCMKHNMSKKYGIHKDARGSRRRWVTNHTAKKDIDAPPEPPLVFKSHKKKVRPTETQTQLEEQLSQEMHAHEQQGNQQQLPPPPPPQQQQHSSQGYPQPQQLLDDGKAPYADMYRDPNYATSGPPPYPYGTQYGGPRPV